METKEPLIVELVCEICGQHFMVYAVEANDTEDGRLRCEYCLYNDMTGRDS